MLRVCCARASAMKRVLVMALPASLLPITKCVTLIEKL